jgi:selenide,water dikinase
VYRLGDVALVATVDVFTPIVDDPFDFGQIAAANALSDVYAMGARPLFALSIVGFPVKTLPLEVLEAILRGGAAKAGEAGIAIVGGHSIDDPEPKYGLSVVGAVDPARVVRNSTARAGDVLFLTKPIGTGVVTQGVKLERTAPTDVAAAVATMAALNRDAADAMIEVGVSAATDVTGFGLLGHLHEVAHASGVSARVAAAAVPVLPGARALAQAGVVPGGSRRNAQQLDRWVSYAASVDAATQTLLCDAQTSGGLLVAVPAERAGALAEAFARRGVTAVAIGGIEAGEAGRIAVD